MIKFIPIPPLYIHEQSCGRHPKMEAGMNQLLTSPKGIEREAGKLLIYARENDCWYDGNCVVILEAKR